MACHGGRAVNSALPRLDRGKPCGASYIPTNRTCTKPATLTPVTVTQAPVRTGSWKRRAAIAAGATAAAAAVGLPAAGFWMSGSPSGRRAARGVETLAREAGTGLMSWSSGSLAPIGVPLGMGLSAGAEGMRAGRAARRVAESWRTAPGFARGASALATRKSKSAAARRAYITQMQTAWAGGQKPLTPTESRRRAAEVRRVETQAAQLQRQSATRARAARRAARIARTGSPFRSSPTGSELWMREGLLSSNPLNRGAALLSAGALRNLQSTRAGFNAARRPRFYGDAADKGKPCGASHISKAYECKKGGAPAQVPAGPGLTPAKILAAAALAGGAAAVTYAWTQRDSAELRSAMRAKPISDGGRRKPNLVERLLAERRAARCGRRKDALPLSATNECAESTFAEIYLSKDGNTVFKVQRERDLPAAKREFKIHSAAYALGVPTARPLAIHPKTGVIRMEHLKGRTGEEIFGERFDSSRYPSYGLQLSAALRKLHKAGLAHGDLHIGNWIETRDGLRLLDWGMGGRKKSDVVYELEDSPLNLYLGLGMGSKGLIRRHPALDGYEDLLKNTLFEIDFLKTGTPEWGRVIDAHYDGLDGMLRQAQQSG